MHTSPKAFQALHEIAVAAAGLRDPRALAALVVDRARDLLATDAAALYWWTPETGLLTTLADNDPGAESPEPPFRPGEGAAGRAFRTARPVRVDDYRKWEVAIPSSVARGIASGMAVPLLVSDRAVGALGVFEGSVRQWREDEERLLLLLAAQVAPALEAARLAQASNQQAHNLRALHEVAIAAGGLRDLSELGRLVVDRARQLLRTESATLRWWDQATQSLRLLAATDSSTQQGIDGLGSGDGPLGEAFQRREPVIVDQSTRLSDRPACPEAAMAVPVMARDEPLGALAVAGGPDRRFTREEAQLLTLLAAQVGPALEAARLYAESERRRRNAEALAELVRQGAQQPDLESVVALITSQARGLLGAAYSVIALAAPDGELEIAGSNGIRGGGWWAGPPGSPGPHLQQAVEGARTVVLSELGGRSAFPDHLTQDGRAAVATPLIDGGSNLGGLLVGWRDNIRPSAEEVSLIEALAGYAVTLIDNARAHERERRLANEAATRSAELTAVIDHIPDGVYVADLAGRIVLMNQAGEELMGLREPGAAGGPYQVFDALTGDRIPETGFAMREALKGWKVTRREVIVRRPAGPDLRVAASAVPIRDAEGNLNGALVVFSDITRESHLLGELAASEEQLRTIFDQAPIGLARVDLSGHVREANLALRTMLGLADADILGTPFARLLGQGDGEPADRIADFIAGGGDHFTAEFSLDRGEGGPRWGSASLSMVRGGDHEPLYLIGMLEDVTSRRARTEQLEYQALHDSLTDLPNRTLFTDRLAQAILTAQREHRRLAVLILDLNRFKEVNDTLGHPLGDALLQQLGPRLAAQLRESDTLARLGGDEFAVVLPTADDEQGAALAASRILQALREPFTVDGRKLSVGGSIGVALAPDDGLDPVSLLRRADTAMYAAKRAGTGFAIYSPEQDRLSPGRRLLRDELAVALDRKELSLHFQPQVAVSDGRVRGVEALLRWQHPRHGLMPAEQFIEIAEESGELAGISSWALDTALAQARLWPSDDPVRVCVNLARANLVPELPAAIEAALRRWDLPPSRLCLEFTERDLAGAGRAARQLLSQLRASGITIALDDYGTGGLTAGGLRDLPVDELKIDQSLLLGLAPGSSGVPAVQAAVAAGHELGLTMVAEGIETEAAWKVLEEVGCELAQGHLVARPLSARQVRRWLAGARSGKHPMAGSAPAMRPLGQPS